MNPWIKRWSPATLAAVLILLSASLGAGQKKAAAAPPAGIQVVEAVKADGLQWKANAALENLSMTLTFPAVRILWDFDADASLAQARRITQRSPEQIGKLSLDTLGRVLYVLEREASSEAGAFETKAVAALKKGSKIDDPQKALRAQTSFYHSLYDLPCAGPLRRSGAAWPPEYVCATKALGPSGEPTPLVTLKEKLSLVDTSYSAAAKSAEKPKISSALGEERQKLLRQRDAERVPSEDLTHAAPKYFCYKGQCYERYLGVATAIYGGLLRSASPPVFCAPTKTASAGTASAWNQERVLCSADWLDTVGGSPWTGEGAVSTQYAQGQAPPFACFGSPHLLESHMILPAGGAVGNTGFVCRRRVFRVTVKQAEKSWSDRSANIQQSCAELRKQTWGDKYPDIQARYLRWCQQDPKLVQQGLCQPPGASGASSSSESAIPYLWLTREELLYFFGHQELHCRADRDGLTHFLASEQREFAKTFTCGLARAILESGPFEEGVQACAIAPFAGQEGTTALIDPSHLKARLHCWKFNRPTCEAVSRDQTQDDLHQSNVFDVLDSLKIARMTQNKSAWQYYDLKEAEKLQSQEEADAYRDAMQDEGSMGVQEFCRFVSSTAQIRCGYKKESMSQWYSMRKDEEPEGCDSGVCQRGAYRRGYYCGLFQAKDYFGSASDYPKGRPFWGCGIDAGLAGTKLLASAKAICVGGYRATQFHSSKGDKSALQCYSRRFRWGESQKTEEILQSFSWTYAVGQAVKTDITFDPWFAMSGLKGQMSPKELSDLTSKVQDFKDRAPKIIEGVVKKCSSGSQQECGIEAGRIDYLEGRTEELLGKAVKVSRLKPAMFVKKDKDTVVSDTWVQYAKKLLTDAADAKLKELKNLSTGHTEQVQKAKSRLQNSVRGDLLQLLAWAFKFGHTLGHRTSMRLALLNATAIPAIKELRALKLGKDLQALVEDVVRGNRAPDEKWYQEFRITAVDETLNRLLIKEDELAVALRVHHLFKTVDAARDALLRQAGTYANAVYLEARRSPLLSRLELLERGRSSPIADSLKGNVFCVPLPGSSEEYACSSSPLLVEGRVARYAYDVMLKHPLTSQERVWEAQKAAPGAVGVQAATMLAVIRKQKTKVNEKARSQARFNWCYGGVAGSALYPSDAPALSETELSSPFEMNVPESVSRAQFSQSDNADRPGQDHRSFEVSSAQADSCRTACSRDVACRAYTFVKPKSALEKGRCYLKKKSPASVANSCCSSGEKKPGFEEKSAANWLKCTAFAYSDENWEQADPTRWARLNVPASQSQEVDLDDTGDTGDAVSAEDKPSKLWSLIYKLLGSLVRLGLAKIGEKAGEGVKDLALVGPDVLDKYAKKLSEKAKSAWESLKKKLAESEGALDKAKDDYLKKKAAEEKALIAVYEAKLKVAGASTATAREQAQSDESKAKADLDAAKRDTKTAQQAITKAESALAAVRKDVQGPRAIEGTGDLLNSLLTDLVDSISEKLAKLVSPYTRKAVAWGLSYAKQVTDPIAQKIVNLVGKIPYVGGLLAAAVMTAYQAGLSSLEDAAVDILTEQIGKLFAYLLRPLLSPLFKVVQGRVLQLVHYHCRMSYPDVCPKNADFRFAALPPKHQWLERALACSWRPDRLLKKLREEGTAARAEFFAWRRRMEGQAGNVARDVANQALSRYGFTVESWVAGLAGSPSAEALAQAELVKRELQRHLKQGKEGPLGRPRGLP